MKQCINLGFVMIRRNTKEKRSFEEALDLCRNADFMLLDHLSPIDEDDYLEVAQRRRAAIDARGMKVVHSHFPFFRYKGPGVREKILKAARVPSRRLTFSAHSIWFSTETNMSAKPSTRRNASGKARSISAP